jgi:membrane protein implicated in regulation of membrane protease activity
MNKGIAFLLAGLVSLAVLTGTPLLVFCVMAILDALHLLPVSVVEPVIATMVIGSFLLAIVAGRYVQYRLTHRPPPSKGDTGS